MHLHQQVRLRARARARPQPWCSPSKQLKAMSPLQRLPYEVQSR